MVGSHSEGSAAALCLLEVLQVPQFKNKEPEAWRGVRVRFEARGGLSSALWVGPSAGQPLESPHHARSR